MTQLILEEKNFLKNVAEPKSHPMTRQHLMSRKRSRSYEMIHMYICMYGGQLTYVFRSIPYATSHLTWRTQPKASQNPVFFLTSHCRQGNHNSRQSTCICQGHGRIVVPLSNEHCTTAGESKPSNNISWKPYANLRNRNRLDSKTLNSISTASIFATKR